MRAFVVILLLHLCVAAHAQHRALTFKQADSEGLTIKKLDNLYKNAVDTDTAKATFTGARQMLFITAYADMLKTLAKYLAQHNFKWGAPTRVFHRIYFAADGSINYYLINTSTLSGQPVKEKQLMKLLNNFVKNYKINITADTGFAQCSPAIYSDSK